jgi:hypothetical protein
MVSSSFPWLRRRTMSLTPLWPYIFRALKGLSREATVALSSQPSRRLSARSRSFVASRPRGVVARRSLSAHLDRIGPQVSIRRSLTPLITPENWTIKTVTVGQKLRIELLIRHCQRDACIRIHLLPLWPASHHNRAVPWFGWFRCVSIPRNVSKTLSQLMTPKLQLSRSTRTNAEYTARSICGSARLNSDRTCA